MKTRIEHARDRLSELVEDPSRPDLHAAAVELLEALNAADNPALVSPPAGEPRTIRQWLETLPDGYRERALANMDPNLAEDDASNMGNAIDLGSYWDQTPEGHNFWSQVSIHYAHIRLALPPLP